MLIDADANNQGSVVGKVIGLRAGRQRSRLCFPQRQGIPLPSKMLRQAPRANKHHMYLRIFPREEIGREVK